MNTTKHAKPEAPAAPLWADMKPAEFDAKAASVQGALFAEPDRCGTADLFGDWA